MNRIYIAVAIATCLLIWAETPLHAIICAGLGACLIETLKWAERLGKRSKGGKE